MTEEGKEDGSVTDAMEEKVQELASNGKAKVVSSPSVSESLKGALQTVKGAVRAFTGGVKKAWSTMGHWKEEGTPIRKAIKTARLEVEDAAAQALERTTRRQAEMRERMETMAQKRKARLEEFDKSGALTKCTELKNQHPELVVGGFTLAVALPSALAGKRAFLRNGAGALVLSSAVIYGGAWMKRRGLTPTQIVGSDDNETSPPMA